MRFAPFAMLALCLVVQSVNAAGITFQHPSTYYLIQPNVELMLVSSVIFAIVIEAAVYWFFLRGKATNIRIAAAAFLINLVAVPAVVYALSLIEGGGLAVPLFSSAGGGFALPEINVARLALGLATVVIEALCLLFVFKLDTKKALIISFWANLTSFIIGTILLWLVVRVFMVQVVVH